MKRPESQPREVFGQVLYARLVTDGRMRIWPARRRLGRIFAALAVHMIQPLSRGVVRLQIVIRDRPSRRNSAVVLDLAEILLAQPKQRSAVEFRVAAYKIVRVWVQLAAVLVVPNFFRLVFAFEVYGARAPVVLLARDVIAAFEQQNFFPARRQLVRQRSAARAASDNDNVVVIIHSHDRTPYIWASAFNLQLFCIPSEAAPKLTPKRAHQMLTDWYLPRSTSAGTS